eukprot:934988-Pleurochrysis_carterae.AAC.1
MAAYNVAVGPRPNRNLYLLVWRVTRRIAALVSVARRRRLGVVFFASLLGDQCSALWPIQLDIASDFASFEIAKHFAYGDQREREIA